MLVCSPGTRMLAGVSFMLCLPMTLSAAKAGCPQFNQRGCIASLSAGHLTAGLELCHSRYGSLPQRGYLIQASLFLSLYGKLQVLSASPSYRCLLTATRTASTSYMSRRSRAARKGAGHLSGAADLAKQAHQPETALLKTGPQSPSNRHRDPRQHKHKHKR